MHALLVPRGVEGGAAEVAEVPLRRVDRAHVRVQRHLRRRNVQSSAKQVVYMFTKVDCQNQ